MALPDLKTVRDRCVEEGDCWLWDQHINSGGHPTCSHEGKNILVRRRVFDLKHGFMPDARSMAVISTCRNALCCNPEHLTAISRSKLVRDSYKSTRNTKHEYAARAMSRLGKAGTKLNFDIAREIRANKEKETAEEAAARLDVSVSLVQKIRQNLIWRDAVPNSSVFHMAA